MRREDAMHHVGRLDWSFADHPATGVATASGLARIILVGPAQGSAHTELAAGALQPAGFLTRHVHSYEEALYVIDGELIFESDGRVHRLVPGDYALNPIGVPHGLTTGPDLGARWISINTPPRRPPDAAVPDTIYSADPYPADALLAAARPLTETNGDPTRRNVGHYDGTGPQAEALAVHEPARGRAPQGMDVALLAYSGISVKMLVDRAFGADHLTMFTVDYEVGGAAQAHDHPFEECYVFLSGTVQAELDGEACTFGPGDVVFAGVGSVHGFWNDGPERVRWLETQAPQPPPRNAYRWDPAWAKVAEIGVDPWPGAASRVARGGRS
jgi:quercetin dioxygenase-like cupin family protein